MQFLFTNIQNLTIQKFDYTHFIYPLYVIANTVMSSDCL